MGLVMKFVVFCVSLLCANAFCIPGEYLGVVKDNDSDPSGGWSFFAPPDPNQPSPEVSQWVKVVNGHPEYKKLLWKLNLNQDKRFTPDFLPKDSLPWTPKAVDLEKWPGFKGLSQCKPPFGNPNCESGVVLCCEG